MHKFDNKFNIGSMWVSIEANNSEELTDVSKGFVCSLHGLLSKNPETSSLAEQIFIVDIIEEWMVKKALFTKAIEKSINKYGMEIKGLTGHREFIHSVEELNEFLSTRRELIPLRLHR